MAAPVRTTVELNAAPLAYWRGGSGPVVLFLHGAGGIHGWEPWMTELARSYDLIVPDHPGWGDSPLPEWFENVHDIANTYLDFADALQLTGVHLVGNSLGGWISCEIAIKYVKHFASLTLAAPAGIAEPDIGSVSVALSQQDATRRLYFDKSIADRIIAQPVDDARTAIQRRNRRSADFFSGRPRRFDPPLLHWMHRITLPTLVLWGADDEVLPHAQLAEFIRRIPGAKAQTFCGTGHLPHVERTREFAEAFESFTGALKI